MSAVRVPRLFGTDGIRDLANHGPLRTDRVLALGEAAGGFFGRRVRRPPRVGLGWDTRISSPAIASALTAGFAGAGAEVVWFGVMPTPAVSVLTRHYGLDAGVVVSASHNPAEDNGIKFFGSDGMKLPDQQERALERILAASRAGRARTGTAVGAVRPLAAEAVRTYTDHLLSR